MQNKSNIHTPSLYLSPVIIYEYALGRSVQTVCGVSEFRGHLLHWALEVYPLHY